MVLGVQSVWVVLPEIISTGSIHFPTDKHARTKLQQTRTQWAASLGVMRGDLWADSGFIYADPILARNTDAALQAARGLTERALSYAPHRSDVWLFFALLSYRLNSSQQHLAAALKMSYYTGSNQSDLAPLRIFVSVSLPELSDIELQEMVRRDIRMIITCEPDLKPAVIAAYKNAPTTTKKFMENVISEVDQQFLDSVRDAGR